MATCPQYHSAPQTFPANDQTLNGVFCSIRCDMTPLRKHFASSALLVWKRCHFTVDRDPQTLMMSLLRPSLYTPPPGRWRRDGAGPRAPAAFISCLVNVPPARAHCGEENLPPFFFFFSSLQPICFTSLHPCLPLSYCVPAAHSVTVCFTPSHPHR